MVRFTVIVCCAVLLAIVAQPSESHAYPSIADDWLANYPDSCQELIDAANDCTLCHGGGFSRNPYGQDLENNGLDFAAIEGIDSDGDLGTNIDEINFCALPGDPTSVGKDTNTWGLVKTLYR